MSKHKMNFNEMIARSKQGEITTRLSWFYRDAAVRYIGNRYDNTSFYIGHFQECTILSGDDSYENYARDEEINADDWIIITKKELETWQKAFRKYQQNEIAKEYFEAEAEAKEQAEQSLITSAIDNGLMGNHICNNTFYIDKEIK